MPRALVVLPLLLILAAAGCGGGDDASGGAEGPRAAKARSTLNGADKPVATDFPRVEQGQTLRDVADGVGATGTQVGLATSVFTTGANRIAFGVLDESNAFVYAPTAIYAARGEGSKDVVGPIVAPADLLVTEPAFRSKQAATEKDPFAAVYAADGVKLDEAGRWLILVVSKVGGRLVAAPTQIDVLRRSPVPEPGERAPKVETDTVGAGGSLDQIDTREPPAAELHEESFADVVGKKPVALLFATPQLCQSRVCGPVVDIALQLKQRYGDRVTFIHQEVYVDNDVEKGLREPLRRFGLPTEPWLFTFGRDGKIAARLEGSFGLKAFERALQAAVEQ